MAYLRKVKNTYQLQFYIDGKKRWKHYSPHTPKSVVLAEKKRIEAEVALHKARIRKFQEETAVSNSISLGELTERVLLARENEVSIDTSNRNRYTMKLFLQVVGPEMSISDLKADHIDQFKNLRYEEGRKQYERKGWKFDNDKIKRGVNKDLENIRTILRAAASKGIISSGLIPKIERFKVDRQRLPKYLDDVEIIAIANKLAGEARLAFWIIRYTGARWGEIARKTLDDERGLKWKDIDWMRNKVRLYAKKKERLVTLHTNLRKLLLERKLWLLLADCYLLWQVL